jgi:hypothetical protein
VPAWWVAVAGVRSAAALAAGAIGLLALAVLGWRWFSTPGLQAWAQNDMLAGAALGLAWLVDVTVGVALAGASSSRRPVRRLCAARRRTGGRLPGA